jgi:hypothetical protein
VNWELFGLDLVSQYWVVVRDRMEVERWFDGNGTEYIVS